MKIIINFKKSVMEDIELFKIEFWDFVVKYVGFPTDDQTQIMPMSDFLIQAKKANFPYIRVMEAEHEYHDEVVSMPIPLKYKGDVSENRIQKYITKLFKEHSNLPVLRFDGIAYY